jgi:hypothetical protein
MLQRPAEPLVPISLPGAFAYADKCLSAGTTINFHVSSDGTCFAISTVVAGAPSGAGSARGPNTLARHRYVKVTNSCRLQEQVVDYSCFRVP